MQYDPLANIFEKQNPKVPPSNNHGGYISGYCFGHGHDDRFGRDYVRGGRGSI